MAKHTVMVHVDGTHWSCQSLLKAYPLDLLVTSCQLFAQIRISGCKPGCALEILQRILVLAKGKVGISAPIVTLCAVHCKCRRPILGRCRSIRTHKIRRELGCYSARSRCNLTTFTAAHVLRFPCRNHAVDDNGMCVVP